MYFPGSIKPNATQILDTITLLGKRTDSEEKNQPNKKTKQDMPLDIVAPDGKFLTSTYLHILFNLVFS